MADSDEIDRDRADARETRESPFATLQKRVAGLKVQDDDPPPNVEEDEPKVVDRIESLCINCEENGETRLFLTKIPYFREIIIMSFSCDHCGFENTDVQSAGQIQERGAKYTLTVTHIDDMERQIVKSDIAVLRLETLDIEVPAGRGRLTNVEGVVCDILKDLETGQRQRKKDHPDLWQKIDDLVQPLLKMALNQNFPFKITLDDPSGNSWIEPSSKDKAGKYQKSEYPRTLEQNAALGLGEAPSSTLDNGNSQPEVLRSEKPSSLSGLTAHVVPQIPTTSNPTEQDALEDVDILEGHSYSLPTPCPGCTKPAHLNLQLINIPFFKQVVVSAVMCTECNYRASDVKTGGEIPRLGKRIYLDVRDPLDLRRDILKSETCYLKIDEIDVEVAPGTMGGRFTTVEGLLTQIRDDTKGTVFDTDDVEARGGDSMTEPKRQAWTRFFDKLDMAIKGELQYTILLEDPLANSYVQNPWAPEPDERLREEEYKRSQEVEDDLGLSDMKTQMGDGGEYERETFDESDGKGKGKAVERLPNYEPPDEEL
ncbi:nucleolar zinc-finger protein [Xanthoria calcicola]